MKKSPKQDPLVPNDWLGTDCKTWAQSIRNGYTRSFLLFALHETGVFPLLRDSKKPLTVKEIAKKCRIDAHLLDGAMQFAYHADKILSKKKNAFSLTPFGREVLFTDMTLTMAFGAIGAYACLLHELVPCLRGEKKYGVDFVRRGDLIAKASYLTGRGNYPWVVEELKRLGVRTVADLGCGSGNILIDFCLKNPELRGVGVDIAPGAVKEATARVKAAGLANRVRIVQGDLTRPETFRDHLQDVDAFNSIMVFHEFLRDGEEAVVKMFKGLKKNFPGRYFLMGEFNRMSDEEIQNLPYPDRMHPLFYQEIIHPLTWQGLPMETKRWRGVFKRAGVKILKVKDDFPFRLVEYVAKF